MPFTGPIVYGVNGVDRPADGGMALVQGTLGDYNTITLPVERSDTLYLVTYGVSLADVAIGETNKADFQLYLNGLALPYTNLSDETRYANKMATRTSLIVNPAGLEGILRVFSVEGLATIEPVTDVGYTAYITVVKLNNNHRF